MEQLVTAIGPIQAQTARSPFLAAAARIGLAPEDVSKSFDDLRVVRGTNIRGTVHASTPEQHEVLAAVTRVAQKPLWERTLQLRRIDVEQLWGHVDEFASQWRTQTELRDHIVEWLREVDSTEAADAVANQPGRYFTHGYGNLLRMPAHGDWMSQGKWLFRSARSLTGKPKVSTAAAETFTFESEAAVREAVLLHLRSYGPATRRDISWWSGLGLRRVDAAISDLDEQLTVLGNLNDDSLIDRIADFDLTVSVPRCAFLPEFDAVLCGFHPSNRNRFHDLANTEHIWNPKNRLCRPLFLLDGRVSGVWQVKKKRLEVAVFPGVRKPGARLVREAFLSVAKTLGIDLAGVDVSSI